MIRDGKKSISRDLVQFLEYIDGLDLKRHRHLYTNAKKCEKTRESTKSEENRELC